jgi:hypothetical protein
MGAPLHCNTCVGGGECWEIGVWVRANGVVVSLLRLQTVMDCAYTGTEPKCRNADTGTGKIKRQYK